MDVLEKFKTPAGTIILSIIWGLGLSTLFKKSCQSNNCKIYKYVNPSVNDVKKSYYNYGGSHCYQFDPIIASCNA